MRRVLLCLLIFVTLGGCSVSGEFRPSIEIEISTTSDFVGKVVIKITEGSQKSNFFDDISSVSKVYEIVESYGELDTKNLEVNLETDKKNILYTQPFDNKSELESFLSLITNSTYKISTETISNHSYESLLSIFLEPIEMNDFIQSIFDSAQSKGLLVPSVGVGAFNINPYINVYLNTDDSRIPYIETVPFILNAGTVFKSVRINTELNKNKDITNTIIFELDSNNSDKNLIAFETYLKAVNHKTTINIVGPYSFEVSSIENDSILSDYLGFQYHIEVLDKSTLQTYTDNALKTENKFLYYDVNKFEHTINLDQLKFSDYEEHWEKDTDKLNKFYTSNTSFTKRITAISYERLKIEPDTIMTRRMGLLKQSGAYLIVLTASVLCMLTIKFLFKRYSISPKRNLSNREIKIINEVKHQFRNSESYKTALLIIIIYLVSAFIFLQMGPGKGLQKLIEDPSTISRPFKSFPLLLFLISPFSVNNIHLAVDYTLSGEMKLTLLLVTLGITYLVNVLENRRALREENRSSFSSILIYKTCVFVIILGTFYIASLCMKQTLPRSTPYLITRIIYITPSLLSVLTFTTPYFVITTLLFTPKQKGSFIKELSDRFIKISIVTFILLFFSIILYQRNMFPLVANFSFLYLYLATGGKLTLPKEGSLLYAESFSSFLFGSSPSHYLLVTTITCVVIYLLCKNIDSLYKVSKINSLALFSLVVSLFYTIGIVAFASFSSWNFVSRELVPDLWYAFRVFIFIFVVIDIRLLTSTKSSSLNIRKLKGDKNEISQIR